MTTVYLDERKQRQMEAGRKAAETRRRNAEAARLGGKPTLVKPSPIYVPPPEPAITKPPLPDLWTTVYRLPAQGLALQDACKQFAAEYGDGAAIVGAPYNFDTSSFRFDRADVRYWRVLNPLDADGDRCRFYHFEPAASARVY